MERLNECRKAKLEADRIAKQIVELQEMGTPSSEINKLWQMLLQERTRWLKQFMEIDRIFGKMSDTNGMLVLRYRYIWGKMWSEVQQRLGYERAHINRIHKRALKEFEQIVEKGTKQNWYSSDELRTNYEERTPSEPREITVKCLARIGLEYIYFRYIAI